MLVNFTFPIFCTIYCHVTVSPTYNSGPSASSTSILFVFFIMLIPGSSISTDDNEPTRKAVFARYSSVMKSGTGLPSG